MGRENLSLYHVRLVTWYGIVGKQCPYISGGQRVGLRCIHLTAESRHVVIELCGPSAVVLLVVLVFVIAFEPVFEFPRLVVPTMAVFRERAALWFCFELAVISTGALTKLS